MGTTLDALLFSGNAPGTAAHRRLAVYLLRDGELTQVTRDHTFVQSLIDEGRITRRRRAPTRSGP